MSGTTRESSQPGTGSPTRVPENRKLGLTAKIILAAFATLAALGLSELFLRFQEPVLHLMRGKYTTPEFLMAPHPVWHHWPRPRATMTFSTKDSNRYPEPAVYTTNSYGCRDGREFAVPKPRGVRRILILGDSFTEGVYAEDTVATHLERRLNESAGNRRVEVINCAATSYSPLLHYLRLKNQLHILEPDEILLNIDLTDVFDDYWNYKPRGTFAPDGEPLAVHGRVRPLERALIWIRYRFYLMRLVGQFRASLYDAQDARKVERKRGDYTVENVYAYFSTLPLESKEWQEEVGFCLQNIARIISFCQQRAIKLTITMYPVEQQLKPDSHGTLWNRAFEQRVEKLCKDSGVDFFSAYEGIRQAVDVGQPVYWEGDIHFTPVGQQIWSELVCDYYARR